MLGRPRKRRRVGFEPDVTYFKPAGVRMIDLEEVVITIEELESIRLCNLKDLNQEKAAKKMKISQPTFHRLIKETRRKITEALVYGKALRIEGGLYDLHEKSGGDE